MAAEATQPSNEFVISDDYLQDGNDDNDIELQTLPNKNETQNTNAQILYRKLKALDIQRTEDIEYNDEVDRDYFYTLFTNTDIDSHIANIILNQQSFTNIHDFISWQSELTVTAIETTLAMKDTAPPRDPIFVAPSSLDLPSIEGPTPDNEFETLMDDDVNDHNTVQIDETSIPLNQLSDANTTSSIGYGDDEKYPLQHDDTYFNTEYAAKRCIRPVRNNVFMEKTVDECNSQEINFEVQRLICCLYFLGQEFDVYQSLNAYLKAIEAESKDNDVSSPYSFSRKRSASSISTRSTTQHEKQEVVFILKKSDTTRHIQWLHMAYQERLSSQQNLKGSDIHVSSKPPDFDKIMHKKTSLKRMYMELKNLFNETISNLTEAHLKANADKYGLNEVDADGVLQRDKRLVEDLKRRLQQRKLGHIGDVAVNNLDVDSDDEIIKKLSTYSMNEELNKYAGNEQKYDPLYSVTPTEDEMICYDSLCRVVFSDNVSSNNLDDIGDIARIRSAFNLLRSDDHAIAERTEGWVTTIDNILSVLLYRDITWYRSNFIGELKIRLVIDGARGTSLLNYENEKLLLAIKQSILYAYIGVPKVHEAADNAFEAEHIILREKIAERAHICVCGSCRMCETNHLVRLTFGIQCDNSRCNTSNVIDAHKFNRKYPYKFLYQTKRIFAQIYRNKFVRLFDSSARKQGAQLKLAEIHTYDLGIYEYPKTEIDRLLTQQFAVPSTDTYRMDTNELATLQNTESMVYGAITKHRTQRANTAESFFAQALDTSNMRQFGDTIIEDDYGVGFETKVVNALNTILSWVNPTVVYKKIEIKRSNKLDDLDELGPVATSNLSADEPEAKQYEERNGHCICRGHCYLTFGMVSFAITMAVIVGIGGYNIYKIAETPIRPTMENILSFTQKMIAAEAPFVAQRALFSTQHFIDFYELLPGIMENKTNQAIFDTFLDDTLIATPQFDGIFQMKHDIISNETGTDFVFKQDDNTLIDYSIVCDDDGNCEGNEALFTIANVIWNHRENALVYNRTVTETYFVKNTVINPSLSGGCIWFVTWRYIQQKECIIGGVFFGWRINEEYAQLTLGKNGLVYWKTNDIYRDVFVTSVSDPILYITQHSHDNSSIGLDTSTGYITEAEYDSTSVDARIWDTMSLTNDSDDYYIYNELQDTSFGSFYIVIVFPKQTVYETFKQCEYISLCATVIAMLCAIINACIANAVPLIPADDSWLATPLFTDQDKKELKENMEMGQNVLSASKERRGGVDRESGIMGELPPTVSTPKTKIQSLKNVFKPLEFKTTEFRMDTLVSRPTSLTTDELTSIDLTRGASKSLSTSPLATGRMRSNSDVIHVKNVRVKRKHSKGVDSLADAKQKMQSLANDHNWMGTVPLKASTYNRAHTNTLGNGQNNNDEEDDNDENKDSDDDDDDDGVAPPFNKAQSVATGLKPDNLAKRDKQRRREKKEIKKKLNLWKKKKQSDQLKKNINNAHMRSIFSRKENKYKTKYAQRANGMINVCCCVIALLIGFSYLALRVQSESDIEELMEAHLNISNVIVERHIEFKVYEYSLALQQGQLLLVEFENESTEANNALLYDFYNIFDELSAIFTFDTDMSNLSIYGSAALTDDSDEECVELYEMRSSYLATCISWKQCNDTNGTRIDDTNDITDCTLYQAMSETYTYFLNDSRVGSSDDLNFIAWSVPFACFGGRKVCYVGLTRRRDNEGMYVGGLLSMHGVADTVQDVVWTQSGIEAVVTSREGKIETSYVGDQVHFSFYLFTSISNQLAADRYDICDDYLLAATGNDIITTTQTAYGVRLSSILPANDSSNDNVQRTYYYLNETNQIVNNGAYPTIVWSSWSYPKIVYYWFENDEGLNWRSVLTMSAEVFLGDHNVYSTLGSISFIGWVIIFLFIHFISYRRFGENIEYWEHLYLRQIEKDTFPLLDDMLDAYEEEEEEDLEEDAQDVEDAKEEAEGESAIVIKSNTSLSRFMTEEQEQLTLDFISSNIRDTVRVSCQQSWIRQQSTQLSSLPIRRKDITDHYHSRALKHIYQAKRGMNIITVVQMEQYGARNEYKLRLYALQSSRSWKWFMHILMIIHILGLVFWRPLTTEALNNIGYPMRALIVECVCLFFEFLDLLLTYFIQFRWQDTAKNPLMSPSEKTNLFIVRCAVWSAVVIDVFLMVFAGQSFTRILPIRPLLLILSNDKLIGACYALVITSLNAADALLLFIILLAIAAVSGVILFRFEDLMQYYNVYSFQNVIRSLWTTYVFIISGENYGELVYLSFENSPGLILYFIVLTVLGSWIVVSLVVSRFQTSFKEIYTKERERRIYFKRTGYVAAFSLINLDDDNEVSKAEFQSFVRYVNMMAHQDDEHIAQLKNMDFDQFDTDGDDSIDIREFVIKLEEIYQKPVLTDILNDDDSLLSWIRLNIVETEAFSQFVLVIILIELILFSLFAIYPGTHSTEMLDIVLGITVLLNGLDIGVKIFSMGWDYYWNISKCRIINRHKTNKKQVALKKKSQQEQEQLFVHEKRATLEPDAMDALDVLGQIEQLIEEKSIQINDDVEQSQTGDDGDTEGIEYEVSVYTQDPLHLKEREFAHRFDLVIVSIAIILFIITRVIVQELWFTDRHNSVRIVMVIPLLRLFTLIKTTRSAIYIITRVIPRFTSLALILGMLFYMYAVIGVWLIGDQLQLLVNSPQYKFETFTESLVSLFQLTVGEGWHDVMYSTVYATNSLLITTWYFVTFVLIITLIFTNLFVGLVISVVDDVETENKFKYGQLQLEYQQEQIEKKLKKQRQQIGKNNNDDDDDDEDVMRKQSMQSDHHYTHQQHHPITPITPSHPLMAHGNTGRSNTHRLARGLMSSRAITQKSQFII